MFVLIVEKSLKQNLNHTTVQRYVERYFIQKKQFPDGSDYAECKICGFR